MTIETYIGSFTKISEPIAKSLWVRDFQSVSTHIRGNRENDIIAKKRPNESDDIHQYRMDNYRAVTKHPFNTALKNIIRIMNHSEVRIEFPESIFDYMTSNNFDDKDIISFFQSDVCGSMIEAANGFLVPWPNNVAQDESEQVQELQFDLIIVNPEDVIHYNEFVFTWLSMEKSLVMHKNKEVMEGDVYYCVHATDGLWKRIQVGKKSDQTFEWEQVYSNPTGEVYAMKLGGDLTSDYVELAGGQKKKVHYLTSYFSPAVPFADECISQFSDNQGTLVSCSFPLREMDSITCKAEGCHNGYITNDKGRTVCGSCNGTGRVPIAPGPYGILLRPPKQTLNPGEQTSTPAITFLHPSVDILKFGGETWKAYLDMVKDALNMLFVDEAQSGIAKQVDREDKIAVLDVIAKQLYGLLRNTVQIIHKFRFPNEDYPEVNIQLPATFVEKSQAQRLEELKQLQGIKAPEVLLASKMRALHASMVNNDPLEMKIYDMVSILDPYYLKSMEEKIRMQSVGVLDSLGFAISDMAPQIIRRIARENPNFIELESGRIQELYNQALEAERPNIERMIGARSALPTLF